MSGDVVRFLLELSVYLRHGDGKIHASTETVELAPKPEDDEKVVRVSRAVLIPPRATVDELFEYARPAMALMKTALEAEVAKIRATVTNAGLGTIHGVELMVLLEYEKPNQRSSADRPGRQAVRVLYGFKRWPKSATSGEWVKMYPLPLPLDGNLAEAWPHVDKGLEFAAGIMGPTIGAAR